MAEHQEHGTMDVTEHRKTFEGFIRTCMIVSAVAVVVLIFLAFVGT